MPHRRYPTTDSVCSTQQKDYQVFGLDIDTLSAPIPARRPGISVKFNTLNAPFSVLTRVPMARGTRVFHPQYPKPIKNFTNMTLYIGTLRGDENTT